MKCTKRSRVGARLLSLLLAVTLAAGLVSPAFAEDAGTASPASVAFELPQTELSLTLGGSTNLAPGAIKLLSAEGTELPAPADGAATWTWEGFAPAVNINWDTNGVANITALEQGIVNATVRLNYRFTNGAGAPQELTASRTCKITVAQAEPDGITLSDTVIVLDQGKTQQLAATVTPENANKTVTWSSDNGNIASVADGLVTAGKAAGKAKITATTVNGKTATCEVQVKGLTLSSTSIAIVQNETYPLKAEAVATAGEVYWESNKPEVATVDAVGNVKGVSPGTAAITAGIRNTDYRLVCEVKVTENTADIITASADAARPLRFSDIKSQMNDQCSRVLGSGLSYVVSLSVPVAQGTLYYGYDSADRPGEGVASLKSYYYSDSSGNLRLSNVTFVPNETYNGAAEIQYTGYNNAGRSFRGIIRVTVSKTNDVTYTTSARQPVYFSASNFNTICSERTGRALDSVKFTLPSADRGTLYYNYRGSSDYDSKVSADQKYGRTFTPSLDKVAFMPADNYTGTLTINYTGYDAGNGVYSGRVTIAVSGSGGGDLSYSTNSNGYARFDSDDFNKYCKGVTNRNLNYVYFTLPSSSQGTLYYNYRSSGSYDSRVSESTRYYRSSSQQLSNVYFVPNSGYSGTATVSFTAYDTDGERVSGVVSIRVDGKGDGTDVSYSCSKNDRVKFKASDFNDASLNYNNYNLNYVRFEQPSSSRGTLYYNYSSSSSTGTKVSSSTNYYRNSSYYLDDVTFVPYSNYTGTVEIDYTAWDVNGGRFDGTVSIRVGTGSSYGDLDYTVAKNGSVTFDADDFNEYSRDYDGNNLNYVRFTLPSSSKGTLYYNYRSSSSYDSKVSNSTSYYRSSSPSIGNVTFVPYTDYTGTVEIDFDAYDTNSNRFTGTVTVRVGSGSSAISYSAPQNGSVKFDANDFNKAANDYNGNSLNYVRFSTPSSSQGTLYYNYRSSGSYDSQVSSSTNYYRSSNQYLDNVSFVPAKNYTGTVSISYTGYTTGGASFSGTVTVRVGNAVSGTTVSYNTGKNTSVTLNADDFNTVSRNRSGYNLNYIKFTLPSSSTGTLYYNYRSSGSYDSKVSSSTSYYRSGTPALSNVTFVPYSGYLGTASISYTAYDTDGGSFTGKLEIQVGSSSFNNTVSYSTMTDKPVILKEDDFNTVSRSYDDNNLSYVRFTLPASNQGTLYYNYKPENKTYDSKVSSSTSYYRQSSPYLYNVTFVPASGFSGNCTFEFTGYDTSNSKFTGKVSVTVQKPVAGAIKYSSSGSVVAFREADFNAACRAVTGEDMVKLRFTPPSSNYGTLCYNYAGPGQYESLVSSGTEYFYNRSPSLASVSFILATGYSGTVEIPYTGEDANGMSFSGTVQIALTAVPATTRFSDMGNFPWAAASVEYLFANGVVTGTSANSYSPQASTSRGDFALMIVRAFRFTQNGAGETFADVPADSYYADAIDTARALGIVEGSGGVFRPNAAVSRQDAMLMLQRAMRASGWVLEEGSYADLAAFGDGSSVASYASSAVGAMVRLGVVQGDEKGRLNPLASITRAEMAVILYRALTL